MGWVVCYLCYLMVNVMLFLMIVMSPPPLLFDPSVMTTAYWNIVGVLEDCVS